MRTLESGFHQSSWLKCLVADQTCKNMPTIMQIVAVVRNMTGICHVYTWALLTRFFPLLL